MRWMGRDGVRSRLRDGREDLFVIEPVSLVSVEGPRIQLRRGT